MVMMPGESMIRMPGESTIRMPGQNTLDLGCNKYIKPVPTYVCNHIPRQEFNPNLLGYDSRPAGWHNRWTEDEKRPWLTGKSEAEVDLSWLRNQRKRDSEWSWLDSMKKTEPLLPPFGKCELSFKPIKFDPPMLKIDIAKIMEKANEAYKPINIEPPMHKIDISNVLAEIEREKSEKAVAKFNLEMKYYEPKYEPIEIAPIMRQTKMESVFKGSRNSHFSYVQGQGFHVTTEIPGLGQGMKISVHDDVD